MSHDNIENVSTEHTADEPSLIDNSTILRPKYDRYDRLDVELRSIDVIDEISTNNFSRGVEMPHCPDRTPRPTGSQDVSLIPLTSRRRFHVSIDVRSICGSTMPSIQHHKCGRLRSSTTFSSIFLTVSDTRYTTTAGLNHNKGNHDPHRRRGTVKHPYSGVRPFPCGKTSVKQVSRR